MAPRRAPYYATHARSLLLSRKSCVSLPNDPMPVLTTLLLLAAPVAQSNDVVLSPAVAFSVHDEPVDGLGDTFNPSGFAGLVRTQSTRADRAMLEYDLTGIQPSSLQSAFFAGQVNVNNAANNGVRTFDFRVYAGNGNADLSDYQAPSMLIGTGSYQPPTTSSFSYSFDATAAVQAALAAGATHVGVRCEGTSNPNFPNILSSAGTLTIKATAGVGSPYCVAAPNATGSPGSLAASGSNVAAGNDLTLTAAQLPPFAFGFFIVSQAQGFVMNAGGSEGNLCLGGSIGRYVGPGQIQQSSAAGSFSLALDLTQTPQPLGFVAASAGDTWNFQAWYRDVSAQGLATSNFTPGLEILFQ